MRYFFENIQWFVLMIGLLVFIHELGHFLFAKLFNVKVLSFSIGFGPKLGAFTKGETTYRVGWIPAGGYVRMLGQYPGMDDISEDEKGRSFEDKPVWQRALILFAGPGFNFLLALGIWLVLFGGMDKVADVRFGYVIPGAVADRAGVLVGDRVTHVDDQAVHHWGAFAKMISSRNDQKTQLRIERDQKILNIELAPASADAKDKFGDKTQRGRIGVIQSYREARIAIIDLSSPAAQAGLITGDKVLSIDGQNIGAWHELQRYVATQSGTMQWIVERRGRQRVVELKAEGSSPSPEHRLATAEAKDGYLGVVAQDVVIREVDHGSPAAKAGLKPKDRIVTIAQKQADGSLKPREMGMWVADFSVFVADRSDKAFEFAITVQRGTELLDLNVTLEKIVEQDPLGNAFSRIYFGAESERGAEQAYTKANTASITLARTWAKFVEDSTFVARSFSRFFTVEGATDQLGSVISIAKLAESTAKLGWGAFFSAMAIISVNLGIVNLLPIPVLDGGNLVFCAIEAIRREPPSEKVREYATLFGFVLIVCLMVFALKNDVVRYILN